MNKIDEIIENVVKQIMRQNNKINNNQKPWQDITKENTKKKMILIEL